MIDDIAHFISTPSNLVLVNGNKMSCRVSCNEVFRSFLTTVVSCCGQKQSVRQSNKLRGKDTLTKHSSYNTLFENVRELHPLSDDDDLVLLNYNIFCLNISQFKVVI